ncbi:MAG: hypothetical protein PVH29_10945 [Candidatus Zixiibacteriota bacterium]|jgi:hypothetical protein
MVKVLRTAVTVASLAVILFSCGEDREYEVADGWITVYQMQAEVDSEGISDLWFNAPDDGWACVDDKILHYDGSEWRVAHRIRDLFPEDIIFFNSLCAVSADNIWASSGWGWKDNLHHFDGDKWEKVPSPVSYANITDTYFPYGDRGWIATGQGVYYYDGGDWTFQVPGAAYDLCFPAENDGWACAGQYIYHWDGSAWTRWEAREMDGGAFYDVSFASPDLGWAVGYGYEIIWEEREYFPLFYRYDGVSWKEVNWPDSDYRIEKCGVAADGTGWVLAYGTYFSTRMCFFDGATILDEKRLGREEIIEEIAVMPGGETWASTISDNTTITRIWHYPPAW